MTSTDPRPPIAPDVERDEPAPPPDDMPDVTPDVTPERVSVTAVPPPAASFTSRIADWLRGGAGGSGDANAGGSLVRQNGADTPRVSFLRPWARREQAQARALQNLSDGFGTLTDLMAGIRDNLQAQQSRQDELLGHLRHLPETLKQIPEASRAHGQTLTAIHRTLEQQEASAARLGDILDELNKGGLAQKESIDDLQKRLERIRESESLVAENLGGVGRAIGDLGKSSTASTVVLERMQKAMDARDGEIRQAMDRQTGRLSLLLGVCLIMSLVALAAAGVTAYLLLGPQAAGG